VLLDLFHPLQSPSFRVCAKIRELKQRRRKIDKRMAQLAEGGAQVFVRIPAKLTDESDDDDRVVNCGAWGLDSNVVGQHGG
jgi:hypothetical protein